MSIPKIEQPKHKRNGRAGVWIVTPFDQGFIDDLKTAVPRADRDWSEQKGAWWVSAPYASNAEAVVLRHFTEVQLIGGGWDGEIVSRDGTRVKQEALAL